MPHANRVTPFGTLISTPESGEWMGNRGRLHYPDGTPMKRGWAGRRWICCDTGFRGRRKAPFAPGRYTPLFFMDEVTAPAAGHRPCALCRREAFERFRTALLGGGIAFGHADDIDERLHLERIDRGSGGERIDRGSGGKRLHHVEWNTLPEGAPVTPDTGSGEAWR